MRCFRKTMHSGFTTASQPNAGFASCYRGVAFQLSGIRSCPLPQNFRASRSPLGCNQYFSKVPAMPWLQVRLAISPEQAETYEDAFLEVGAVSVTFMDAEDQPIFEPELNTTPLWSHTHLLALFEGGTEAASVL